MVANTGLLPQHHKTENRPLSSENRPLSFHYPPLKRAPIASPFRAREAGAAIPPHGSSALRQRTVPCLAARQRTTHAAKPRAKCMKICYTGSAEKVEGRFATESASVERDYGYFRVHGIAPRVRALNFTFFK